MTIRRKQPPSRKPVRKRVGTPGMCGTCPGAELSAEVVEFGRALERYRRVRRRAYPTCGEVLAVARSLGYRKVAERGPLPTVEEATG